MNGMRMLFGKATISTPPPLFCIWAQPGTQSATQPTPNYWTCNLLRERLGAALHVASGGNGIALHALLIQSTRDAPFLGHFLGFPTTQSPLEKEEWGSGGRWGKEGKGSGGPLSLCFTAVLKKYCPRLRSPYTSTSRPEMMPIVSSGKPSTRVR